MRSFLFGSVLGGSSLSRCQRRLGVAIAPGALLLGLLTGPRANLGPTPVQAATTYANPVINGLTINPFVLKSGSKYYAFFNGFDFNVPFNVPMFSSTDLSTWTPVADVMPTAKVGAWADNSSGWKFSSPSVSYFAANPPGRRYVLYYTGIDRTSGNKCIGVATSKSPAGPFTGEPTPLICPTGGAQDASPVVYNGVSLRQVVYRKNGSSPGIYNQLLSANGQSITPDAPYLLYTAQPAWWQNGVVERPSVIVNPGQGVYLLFSGNIADTPSRAVGWTSCDTPFGVLASCSKQARFGTWLAGDNGVESPSGVQAFSDGTNQWIVYDGLLAGSCGGTTCTGTRSMRIDKVCFAQGVPRTNGPTATPQTINRNSNCSLDIPGHALSVSSVNDAATLTQPAGVVRDGGASAPIGGRTLWLFGDTLFPGNFRTNTAALGVPAVGATSPNWTTEPLDSNGAPFQFIPFTTEEANYNSEHYCPPPCDGTREALWNGGATTLPDGSGLVFFHRVLVLGSLNYIYQALGAVHVPAGSTTADRDPSVSPVACNPTCLFGASIIQDARYGTPLVGNGYIYLFGDGKVARAPTTNMEDPSAYQFWTGSEWSPIPSQAVALPNLLGGGSFSYNPYLDAYLHTATMVNCCFSSDIRVQTAPDPTGPWTAPQILMTGITPPFGFNNTAYEHPELSMNNGRIVAVTYSHPTGSFAGEIRYVTVTLQ